MATTARTYLVTYKDGKGTYTLDIAAASAPAARKIVTDALTEFHEVTDVKHKGHRKFRVVPNVDETGTVFESVDEKVLIRFDTDHPSQPFLRAHFATETAKLEKYLDQQRIENE